MERKIGESGKEKEYFNDLENFAVLSAAGLEKCIERQRVKEEHLYPLRINERITILVSRERCNNEYAEAFRKKVKSV